MKSSLTDSLVTAIDIGTTKICVLIGRLRNGHCEIIGIGKAPSNGLARGVVVDIIPAVESIRAAVREAELMAGVTIESAAIGISGSHIHSLNSHGMVAIKHGEVKKIDVAQVITAAKAIALPEGQQILHVLPQFFTLDNNHRVKDPVGMYAVRMEAQVHIITGAVASVQNLIRCCEMAGIKARDIILEPLASADAVLSADEQELGVGMLDIGGGTADFAIYQQGSIRHTRIFMIAGNLFTNDIAVCLRTTRNDAERIKKEYGLAYSPLLTKNDQLTIEMVHGMETQTVWRHELTEILESRATELLTMVKEEIERYHLQSYVSSGLVLTGGGSLLHGMPELAESILGIPVRVGNPHIPSSFKESLNNPMYATGYGLLVHTLKKHKTPMEHIDGPLIKQVLWRMKSWVFDFF